MCICIVYRALLSCAVLSCQGPADGEPSWRSAMSGETLVEASSDTDVENEFFCKEVKDLVGVKGFHARE